MTMKSLRESAWWFIYRFAFVIRALAPNVSADLARGAPAPGRASPARHPTPVPMVERREDARVVCHGRSHDVQVKDLV